MRRRDLLRGAAGATIGFGLAGCLGGGAPPPRRAEVFEDVSLADRTTLRVALVDQPQVETRVENLNAAVASALGGLSPVGVASAAKGARGATGRGSGGYSSAPKGRHGWAVWRGGTYGRSWRDDHDDEVRMAAAAVPMVGVAWLGSNARYDEVEPGPGDEPLDRRWENPPEGGSVTADPTAVSPGDGFRSGWYRVEARVRAEDGEVNLGRQAADLRLSPDGIERGWHVAPRL